MCIDKVTWHFIDMIPISRSYSTLSDPPSTLKIGEVETKAVKKHIYKRIPREEETACPDNRYDTGRYSTPAERWWWWGGGRRNACAVTVRSEELVPAIADPIDWIRTPSKGPHLPSRVWSIDLWDRLMDSVTWMVRNLIFFFQIVPSVLK